jgi:hypothetical protein
MKTNIYRKIGFSLILIAAQAYYLQAQFVEKDEPKRKIAKIDTTQKKERKFDASEAVMLAPNYTAQFPFGNEKQRYGFSSLFSMQILYKTNNNWLVGINGGFIYGTKVKEDYLLSNISAGGLFITQFNDLTSIKIEQWGMNIQANAGKIIPFSQKYPDAGIMLVTGFGFLQNKIAYNVKASELPQLSADYKKGYDRLDNGPVISQFVGGTFMARRRYFSGYAGLQFDAGFTRDRRPYDFYTNQVLNDKRYDLFVGVKVGFVLPIWLKTSEKEFFYY